MLRAITSLRRRSSSSSTRITGLPRWPIPGKSELGLCLCRLLRSIDPVLQHVAEVGIDGMECFPPSHHAETGTTRYITFAHEHNLIATSGSDYHGTKDPEVTPGHNIFPEEEKEKTLAFLRQHSIL